MRKRKKYEEAIEVCKTRDIKAAWKIRHTEREENADKILHKLRWVSTTRDIVNL